MDKALIVGINNAESAPLLRGTHTDCEDMANILIEKYAFKPENIRMLFDERAKSSAIRDRIDNWLALENGNNDRIVFMYSGHGAQKDYRANYYPYNVISEYECLVPFDFDWDKNDSAIYDKQIACTFGDVDFRGIKTVFLDCCHAGGMDKNIFQRFISGGQTAKGINSPADIAWRKKARGENFEKTRTEMDSVANSRSKNFTLVSACTAEQTSADCKEDGKWRGAFTWAFGHALKDAVSATSITSCIHEANRILKKYGYKQTAQVKGANLNRPFMWYQV